MVYYIFAYLIASIPFIEWLFFVYEGKRLSEVGTKNTGVANIFLYGKKWMGILSVLWLASTTIGILLYGKQILNYSNPELSILLFFMILGNMYPIFNKFKGSKGRTILIYGMMVINAFLLIPMAFIWWATYFATKKSTEGVLINALILPIIVYFVEDSILMASITALISGLVLLKNREEKDDFKELQKRSK